MENVFIFWTGGWDSTYRVVELSRMQCTITPVYIYEKERVSSNKELAVMQDIMADLKGNPSTKCVFNPIIRVDLDEVRKTFDDKLSSSWEKVRKMIRIGSQYLYLGQISKKYPSIELGIEKPNGEYSGIMALFTKYGKLDFDKDGVGYLDVEETDADVYEVFGSIRYPIVQKTELDMLRNIKEWGYDSVMKKIHFCHHPLRDGSPCGVCRPCEQKVDCGMGFLLPRSAKMRCYMFKLLPRWKFRGALVKLLYRFF